MEVKFQWKGSMKFEATAPSGHTLILDSSPASGGTDQGPRPMELVLVALGGCTAMDVVAILNKMKHPLEGFSIKVEAERAREHPKVYTRIHITYRFTGKNLDRGKIEKAVRLSQEKYCSVSEMLRRTAELTYSIELEETLEPEFLGA